MSGCGKSSGANSRLAIPPAFVVREGMFYLAKSLQAAAMGVVALALYVGFTELEKAQTKEITMLGIGVVMFLLGRMIEAKA